MQKKKTSINTQVNKFLSKATNMNADVLMDILLEQKDFDGAVELIKTLQKNPTPKEKFNISDMDSKPAILNNEELSIKCCRAVMTSHVPFVLAECKKYLEALAPLIPKSVNYRIQDLFGDFTQSHLPDLATTSKELKEKNVKQFIKELDERAEEESTERSHEISEERGHGGFGFGGYDSFGSDDGDDGDDDDDVDTIAYRFPSYGTDFLGWLNILKQLPISADNKNTLTANVLTIVRKEAGAKLLKVAKYLHKSDAFQSNDADPESMWPNTNDFNSHYARDLLQVLLMAKSKTNTATGTSSSTLPSKSKTKKISNVKK